MVFCIVVAADCRDCHKLEDHLDLEAHQSRFIADIETCRIVSEIVIQSW